MVYHGGGLFSDGSLLTADLHLCDNSSTFYFLPAVTVSVMAYCTNKPFSFLKDKKGSQEQ